MTRLSRFGTLVVMTLLIAAPARAAVIFEVDSALSASDPTQLGRLSRNGLPQDWTGGEVFPGVINTTMPYRYHVYVVPVGLASFIQISVDTLSVDIFASAYDTAYLPNSAGAPNFGFNTNWLGDGGISGNFFPGDPLFFQVRIPVRHNLLLVISETTGLNAGVGDQFHALVEGFADSSFREPAVPEPASLLLGGIGVALTAMRRRRRA